MSIAEGDPGMDHSSSDNAHAGVEIEQQHSNQAGVPFTTEDMINAMGEAMDRMANDEAERLKVAKRLF